MTVMRLCKYYALHTLRNKYAENVLYEKIVYL